MSFKELVLSGGKGGGGAFKNRPDNLRSTDSFEALIGIVSNRATLAPGGLQNLFVNDVAVEDESGHSQLEDFSAAVFDGDPTQLEPIKLTLGSSAGPTNINLTLTNPQHTPGEVGPWVNGFVAQQNVDFLDLRLVVNQLVRQDKKGIYDAEANVEVQLRPSGSADWINPLLGTAPGYDPNGIADLKTSMKLLAQRQRWDETGSAWADTGSTVRLFGKTTSPYVKEVRIAVPNTGAYANKTWEVRCRLLERDYYVGGEDNLDEEHRDILWESVAGVSAKAIGGTEGWRGVSYVQIFGKASDQINGIPTIQGIYDIGRYAVPPSSVFNPATQTYTGAAWDGVTTQIAWTRDPAWQLKGLIEDDLSGVSALVPGSTLNKWDVLEASKWFAVQVPDGRGGTQPRYTANWLIEQPQNVNDLVNYLAGAVGAFAWDEGDGRWRMKVEKPETPQMIFTKENIIGEFIYSHTDWDSRFNEITGVYRDRDNRYKENRVRTFDQPNIDQTGRRATTLTLVGCDNRQEALRRIELRKITALKETRIVTFVTNRQGGLLEPFSVIGVADGDLNSSTAIRSTGRIISLSGDRTSFAVRDALRLEVGVAYQVQITIPNPSYSPETTTQPTSANWRKPTITITRNIVNSAAQRGDVYELFLDVALPANVPEFATVALSAVGLPALPKQYRVLAVIPDDSGENFSVTASEIYTAKWVESDNVVEEEILAQVAAKIVPPPMTPPSGMFVLKNFTSEYSDHRLLAVNWSRPILTMLEGYRVEMQHNGGPWQDLGFTKDTYVELQDPAHGIYVFRIYARDRNGRESDALSGTYAVAEALPGFAISAFLTNESHTLPANVDGSVPTYAGASGEFKVYSGAADVSDQFTLSTADNRDAVTISYSDQTYSVTDGLGALVPSASVTIRATGSGAYTGIVVEKVFSIATSRGGASAKIIKLTASAQTFKFDKNGTAVVQTVTFALNRQNTTTLAQWAVLDRTGTNITGFLSAAALGATPWFTWVDDDTLLMSEAEYVSFTTGAPTRETFSLVARLIDGVTLTDKVSVTKVQDGATGATGASALSAVLTNETHTLPANTDGSVSSYTGASGQFKIYSGAVDVSSLFTLATAPSGNPQAVTIGYSAQTYTLTSGLGASVPTATVTIRATGSGAFAGITLDKVFTVSTSKAGATGTAAKLISISPTAQVFRFDKNGTALAATVTLRANRQNIGTATAWRLLNSDGTARTAYVTAAGLVSAMGGTSSPDNDTVVVDHNIFRDRIGDGDGKGLIFEVLADGLTDRVTIIKVQDGVDGAGTTTLINKANMTIAAGTVTKSSGSVNTWDASVHSAEGYVGDVMAIGQVVDVTKHIMIGLTTDPNADPSYASIDFAAYSQGGGAFEIYENATYVGSVGAIANGDFIYARRRGTTIEYGVLGNPAPRFIRTGVSATTKLYLDSSFYELGAQLKSVQLMPLAADGAPALVGYLTNESVTLPADKDGNVLSYAGATTSVRIMAGLTDVTSLFSISTGSNPQALSVSGTNPYSVVAGFDAGEDTASFTFRATGTGAYAGVIIDKVFSLAKSKTGQPGSNGASAKQIFLLSDRQLISYDGTGALSPATQTTTFTATVQNSGATVNWSMTRADGVAISAGSYLSATTGASVTMTAANFDAARAGTEGVIVTATITDGVTLSDKISVNRVRAGANGTPGVSPVTIDLTVLSIDVAADANNITKTGALPKGSLLTLKEGTTPVSPSSVTFAYSDGGAGGFSASYDTSTKTVSLNTANAAGWVDVNAVYGGVTYTKRITVTRTKDNQAPSSPTNDFASVTGGTSSTTYDGSGVCSPEIILKANASGQLVAGFSAEYFPDNPPGSVRNITVGARFDIAPQSTGVFSSPVAEAIGSQATWDKTDSNPGAIGMLRTFTGLTAGAFYRVRVNIRKVSGNQSVAAVFNGEFTVSQ